MSISVVVPDSARLLTVLRTVLLTVLLGAMAVGCKAGTMTPKSATTLVHVGVHVGLTAQQKTFRHDEAISVRYFIDNKTDQPFAFLPWGTGLEEPLTADRFDVFFNGERVPYIGIMVKRLAPVEADTMNLQAGEVVAHTVTLSRAYDMREPGEYIVQLKTSDGRHHIGSQALTVITVPVELIRLPG